MASKNDVNTPLIAIIGFLGAVVVFAIIIALQVMFYRWAEAEKMMKDIAVPPAQYDSLVAAQQAQLAEYRIVDPERKIVTIPINQAMNLVAERVARGEAVLPSFPEPSTTPEAPADPQAAPVTTGGTAVSAPPSPAPAANDSPAAGNSTPDRPVRGESEPKSGDAPANSTPQEG
ncbi:MAG: hypothetical protein ACOY3P_19510 [Planctomycetota bacterium]